MRMWAEILLDCICATLLIVAFVGVFAVFLVMFEMSGVSELTFSHTPVETVGTVEAPCEPTTHTITYKTKLNSF